MHELGADGGGVDAAGFLGVGGVFVGSGVGEGRGRGGGAGRGGPSFLLSYGTRDGMVGGITPWPDSVDFVFNADDLARIQILHYMVATRACPYSSLAWCFRENTALKGLKKVSFQFLEGYKYGLVVPRGGFLNDLWRKEEAAQYCRRLRAKLEDLGSKNSLQLTILTRGADWN